MRHDVCGVHADWGRTGGLRSITNASMPGGLDTTGFCGTNFGGASAVADETRGGWWPALPAHA